MDWCNQAAPASPADTHALGFYWNTNLEGVSFNYRGLLFYRPRKDALRGPGLHGRGRLLGNQLLRDLWLHHDLAYNSPATHVEVFLSFHNGVAGIGNVYHEDGDPDWGAQVFEEEFDETGHGIAGDGGLVGFEGARELNFRMVTVSTW